LKESEGEGGIKVGLEVQRPKKSEIGGERSESWDGKRGKGIWGQKEKESRCTDGRYGFHIGREGITACQGGRGGERMGIKKGVRTQRKKNPPTYRLT